MAKRTLTPKSEDTSKWYTQVIQQAGLADYSPVKGCMVFRPDGYAIWEQIHDALDPKLKALGVRNAYFPMFIPMSLLAREADHVEGFAPELAVVTHGGGEELTEKLAVRPTSETIMYEMYKQWVQSYRDLPLNLNQWNNVVRWEKRTYFFLRTTEFLWQEAHTAHATHDESMAMVLSGLEAYRQVLEEVLAIPVFKGRKSASERFAGADLTTTVEAMMPDGKALQAGTSHDLGQNFSKASAFNISFQNEKGETDYAWQTSYGFSTRTIGALILTHGDDDGLVLPPKVAAIQVQIVPVKTESDQVMEYAQLLKVRLQAKGVRVDLNQRPDHSLGWKLNDAELRGIPVVLVIGEKEMKESQIAVHIRHDKSKRMINLAEVEEAVPQLLEEIQTAMFDKAVTKRDSQIHDVTTYEEFKEVMNTTRGFIRCYWAEDKELEAKIKEETKATTRCLPFVDDQGGTESAPGKCFMTGKETTQRWLFAQAY